MKIPMQMGGVQEVATGITGVAAYKSGNIVTLAINIPAFKVPSEAWQTIGILPQELRPASGTLRFAGFDNTVQSQKTSFTVQLRILSTGQVDAFFFGDKLTMSPNAVVTYITD